jgi:hypothetical protein
MPQFQNCPPTAQTAVGLFWPAKFLGLFLSFEIRVQSNALRKRSDASAPRFDRRVFEIQIAKVYSRADVSRAARCR